MAADTRSPRSSNEFGNATTMRTVTTTTTTTTTAAPPPKATAPAAMYLSPPSKNLTRSSTVPSNLGAVQRQRSHLAPEDAFGITSPPRQLHRSPTDGVAGGSAPKGDGDTSPVLRRRRKVVESAAGGVVGINGRPRSRKRRRSWKKLLWVDRAYPDNYTDQATFLEQLQRNPRLQPYLFWPLVADTTIIVQHVCSVILFVVSFVGIFQDRVDHRDAVSFSSIITFAGWLLWEKWVTEEEVREDEQLATGNTAAIGRSGSSRRAGNIRRRATLMQEARQIPSATAVAAPETPNGKGNVTKESLIAVSHRLQQDQGPKAPNNATHTSPISSSSQSFAHLALPGRTSSSMMAMAHPSAASPPEPSRSYRRLATIKSAALISSILLGLSPILKSLTRSTSSDSIWAMCFCLLAINITFFDYSGDVSGANFPASLSTNAALMASTVLASRLPETGQVFSLTVLSIEVFGLFPVFRRYARHRSWRYHVVLTALLVFAAGAGVGLVVAAAGEPGAAGTAAALWNALFGVVLGAVVTALAMGGCSWWLIGLQKYKNEINGPWDAARPVIISRRYWND